MYVTQINYSTTLYFFGIIVVPLCALIESEFLQNILYVTLDLSFLSSFGVDLPFEGKFSLRILDEYIPFFKGAYDDLNLGWYRDSGVLLLMTAIVFLMLT